MKKITIAVMTACVLVPSMVFATAGDRTGFSATEFYATASDATSTFDGGFNVLGTTGLWVQSGSGNTSVGSPAFDQLQSKFRVRTATSDGSTGGITVQDPSQRYTFLQFSNGRINTNTYQSGGGVMAMYNLVSPSTPTMPIAHYAYGSNDDLGHTNTNNVLYAYMTDNTSTSLDSKFSFCYMHDVNDSPSGVYAYQQPNECLDFNHDIGFRLPSIAITSASSVVNLNDLVYIASSSIPTYGPISRVTGGVGIGTTTPVELLSVGDTSRSGNPALKENNMLLWSYNTGAGQGSRLIWGMNVGGGAPYSKVAEIDTQQYTPVGVNAMNFKVAPWGNAYSATSAGKPLMTILSNGNVGIGTTTPATRLHVSSGANATTTVTVGQLDLVTSKSCVNMNRADGGPASFYISANGVMVVETNYCR